jgi:anti-sigma B factor antagonist
MKDEETSARPFDFDVGIRRQGFVGFVFASGEIDMATADQLAESIAEICDQDVGEVVVDLRDVTFMDCSGVNVILDARRSADESKMQLTFIPSASVVRVLEILELEQLVRDPKGMARSKSDGSTPTFGGRGPTSCWCPPADPIAQPGGWDFVR